MFGIALDEQKENDHVEIIDNHSFVVEEDLVEIYKGFVVDYTESWFGKGFYVRAQYGGSSC